MFKTTFIEFIEIVFFRYTAKVQLNIGFLTSSDTK